MEKYIYQTPMTGTSSTSSQDSVLIKKSRHWSIINSITQILQMYRHHVDKIIQWLVHRSTQFVTNQLFTWHSIWSYTSIRDYCSKQEGDILVANSDIEFPMSSSDSVNEGVVMCIPRFLSRVPKTWLSGGSTSRCCIRMRRCRWMRTTLGHLTNRCRSFLGGRALPIPNCFSLFLKSGSVTFFFLAGTGALPPRFLASINSLQAFLWRTKEGRHQWCVEFIRSLLHFIYLSEPENSSKNPQQFTMLPVAVKHPLPLYCKLATILASLFFSVADREKSYTIIIFLYLFGLET